MDNKPSSTGLPANIAGLLCYVFGFITGGVFLAIEKDSEYVRFHAMQSLVTFLGLFVASFACGFIPFVGWALALLLGPLQFILWILLMYKAYSGERYKLPVFGDITETQLAKHFPPASPPAAPRA